MDRDRLLNAVRQYCINNGYSKTAKEIKTVPLKVDESENIENVFVKYFAKENKPKNGLGFTFKLPTGKMDFRKRLREIDITEEKGKENKKRKQIPKDAVFID